MQTSSVFGDRVASADDDVVATGAGLENGAGVSPSAADGAGVAGVTVAAAAGDGVVVAAPAPGATVSAETTGLGEAVVSAEGVAADAGGGEAENDAGG